MEYLKNHLSGFIVTLDNYKVIRSIGKGGFGEVFEAEDVTNHNLVAVKKLLTNKLEGKQLKFFCREVEILSQTDNPFVLPFHGFTVTYPFSIITQFIPNYTLFDALRHKPNSPLLSPTHKTLIAMAIANGMAHLHDLNIIHRDLKSLNILLDEKFLPKICDFGIARFKYSDEQHVTQEIGTPHWMAPETFEGTDYTNKVDVYSYAMLLWEMLVEDTPFKGKSAGQIMTAVCKNKERPTIPKNTPNALRVLIQQCWHQNPEDRPPFAYIYKLFSKKKVMFEGTDEKEVETLAKTIRKGAKIEKPPKQNQIKDKKRIPAPNTQAPQGFDFINDISLPNYDVLFNSAIESLEASDSESFFITSKPLLENTFTPTENLAMLLDGYHRLLLKNNEFITTFIKNKIHLILPFENPSLVDQVFRIMIQVLCLEFDAYPVQILQRIMVHIKNNARKVVRVISIIFESFDKLDNEQEITSLLFDNGEEILEFGGGVPFLQLLNYLIASYPSFRNVYLDNCVPLINKAVNSTDKTVVLSAYSLICTNWDERLSPPDQVLFEHIKYPELAKSAISVIGRKTDFIILTEYFEAMIPLIEMMPNIVYFICHHSEQLKNAREVFRLRNQWMPLNISYTHKFRILLVLMKHKEIMEEMRKNASEFTPIMQKVVDSGELEAISTIPTFINFFNIDEALAKDWCSKGMVETILKVSVDVVSNIEMINKFSEVFIDQSYLPIVPQISLLLSHGTTITKSIMSTILKLSRVSEFHSSIKESEILKAITQRVVPKDLEGNVIEILRNIGVSLDDTFGF